MALMNRYWHSYVQVCVTGGSMAHLIANEVEEILQSRETESPIFQSCLRVYTLAHELYPGKFRPTLTHALIRLLSEHSLLCMCFTQNIDTLERRAGVPLDKIVEAHGSFATERCIKCRTPFDDAKMKEMVLNLSPRIIQRETDLLIVIGTSLTVHPFASLAFLCPDECPRALINIFGSRDDDVVLLGKCDEVIEELCEELGWEEELLKLWEETARSTDAGAGVAASASESQDEEEEEAEEATTPTQEQSAAGKGTSGGDEKKLEDEVAKLAEKIQKEMDLRRASVEPEKYVPPPLYSNGRYSTLETFRVEIGSLGVCCGFQISHWRRKGGGEISIIGLRAGV
ncbi:hypothetical protein GYMLUDRAFT_252400 [Collybiopsis luxurians FD-317 M1]|uniref:Unplaced genomic scaffold GYMLUscaffold_126, whole genome shotgun sequence n=1 Tax=Collybiopsis luxurians FD-317 M1 TaxID=944289 RepID=A0A0D0C0G5_9AGAR|nr:hypothetical protein GYMLUDRAFT_252400 [Collybiopsis luxurians FD-317 M1]